MKLPFRAPRKSRATPRSKSRDKPCPTVDENPEHMREKDSRTESRSKSRDRSMSRKRKRNDSQETVRSENKNKAGTGVSKEPTPEPDPWTTCPPQEAKSCMPPEVVEQYELAGMDYHEPQPRGRFPHARFDKRDPKYREHNRLTNAEMNKALSKLKPPPLGTAKEDNPNLTMKTTSLKQQAASIMTTIMHMSLARNDYDRAGRAFAMLLRTHIQGRAIDLRDNGVWGVGVELLLHRGDPRVPQRKHRMRSRFDVTRVQSHARSRSRGRAAARARTEGHQRRAKDRSRTNSRWRMVKEGKKFVWKYQFENSDDEREARKEREAAREAGKRFNEEAKSQPYITREGWERARSFFDRLIVQYPPTKMPRPARASAPDFYMVMYSLWIAHIQALQQAGERRIKKYYGLETDDESPDDNGRESASHESRSRAGNTPPDKDKPQYLERLEYLDELRVTVLNETRELAKNMDAVIMSYPYSDNHELIRLRGMIEQWFVDLCVPVTLTHFHGKELNRPAVRGIKGPESSRDENSSSDDESKSSSDFSEHSKTRSEDEDVRDERRRVRAERMMHVAKAEQMLARSTELKATEHLRTYG